MRTKLGYVTVHANIEETQSSITNKENYKRTNWKQFEKNEYQELFYHKWDLDMTNTGPSSGLFLITNDLLNIIKEMILEFKYIPGYAITWYRMLNYQGYK